MTVECQGALFSSNRTYRFALWRMELPLAPPVAFVMLNPSTADESKDDPTIRRCIRYAATWGHGGIVVLNIFGLRSTDPRNLSKHSDPVGEGNRAAFKEYLPQCSTVVCAWGNHGKLGHQGENALSWIRDAGKEPYALRVSKMGEPCHPLYLPANLKPRPLAELRTTGE